MKIRPAREPGRVVVETSTKDETLLAKAAAAGPFKLKHILVPIDFSDCSRKALRYAVPFARQFGASLTLLNVVGVNYGGGEFGAIDFATLEKQMAESAADQLKRLLEEEVPADVPADAVVRIGHPASSIADTARQRNTDLIIISTHGYTGLKHILLGSVTENVVRHAPCPVLTVREHEHEFVTA